MGRFFASRFFQTPGLQEFYLTSFGGGGGILHRAEFFSSLFALYQYILPQSPITLLKCLSLRESSFSKIFVPKGVPFF